MVLACWLQTSKKFPHHLNLKDTPHLFINTTLTTLNKSFSRALGAVYMIDFRARGFSSPSSCEEKKAMWSGWSQDEHKTLILLFPELARHYLHDILAISRSTPDSPFVAPIVAPNNRSKVTCVCPPRLLVVSSSKISDVFGPRDTRGHTNSFIPVNDNDLYWSPPLYFTDVQRLSIYSIFLEALLSRRRAFHAPIHAPMRFFFN